MLVPLGRFSGFFRIRLPLLLPGWSLSIVLWTFFGRFGPWGLKSFAFGRFQVESDFAPGRDCSLVEG